MSTSSRPGTASSSSASGVAFQRARRPEQKAQRRQDILSAAAKLGTRDGVRAVTLTDIAAEAGVHKSAVLRYFETREAVFLLLTAEHWEDWAAALEQALPEPASAQRVAAVLAGTLAQRPLFCDLLAQAPLNLERGVSEEEVRGFKLTALAAVDRVRQVLHAAMPWLAENQGTDIVAGVTAFAAALWQTANPPETLARLYASDPRLGHAAVDFTPRLERLIALLLAGAATAAGEPDSD
jgi:AcrR family transcriptional regulator